MRLDHLSYVASHDHLLDEVQRIGARLGSGFTDGGIHPRFGTRNFTLALQGGRYLEIVCPLDHPAADASPFGKVVTSRANDGGGWLTWVLSVEDIKTFENRLGRESVDGQRRRPSGTDLKWKQIGVQEIADTREFPFFIEWLTTDHPSQDGTPQAEIKKITIADQEKLSDSWFKDEILGSLGDVVIEWIDPDQNDSQSGIVSVHLSTPTGMVTLD